MTSTKAARAELRTPWRLRFFRRQRLRDLRLRAATDRAALEDLRNELVVWIMESMRRDRVDELLVAAEESVAVHRQLASLDDDRRRQLAEALQTHGFALLEQGRHSEAERPVVEALELARTLRAEGDNSVDPLIRSGLAALAVIRMDDQLIRDVVRAEDQDE